MRGKITMIEKIPNIKDITDLIRQPLFEVWTKLCAAIDEKYDMEHFWNTLSSPQPKTS